MDNPLAPHIRRALDKQRMTLTKKEETNLLQTLYTHDHADAVLTDLYFRSGCRTSEPLIICRHHLDSDASLVVFETLKQQSAEPVYREVPIPRYLMAHLLAFPVGNDQQLFPIHRSTAWRHVKAILLAGGIPDHLANIKTLRHCYNERGMQAAIEKRHREALMGHQLSTREKTSNDHYGCLRGRHLRREAMIMGGWSDHE